MRESSALSHDASGCACMYLALRVRVRVSPDQPRADLNGTSGVAPLRRQSSTVADDHPSAVLAWPPVATPRWLESQDRYFLDLFGLGNQTRLTCPTRVDWIASYAGDSNNNGFTTTCGATTEQISVGKASPSTGTAGVNIPSLSDTATFSATGAVAPTGSVSFTLYSDTACTVRAVPAASGSGTISTTGSTTL
jgi:hypothetical protein